MRPNNIFQLELASVFATPRSILIRLGYAYVLGLPFALISMPIRVRVIGIVLLVLFTSFYGASTTIVARKSDGILARLGLLPIHKTALYGDILLSGSVVDLLQAGVVIVLLLIVNGSGINGRLIIVVAGSFLISVLLLNILGMFLGAISKNSQEVHITGSLGLAVIGFFSGIYPVPGRLEGIITVTSFLSPLRWLALSLEWSMAGGERTGVKDWHLILSVVLLIALIVLVLARALEIHRRSSRSSLPEHASAPANKVSAD